MKFKINWLDMAFNILVFLISIYLLVYSMGTKDFNATSPFLSAYFFPRIWLVLLIFFIVMVFIEILLNNLSYVDGENEIFYILITLATSVVYLLVVNYLGFFITTFFYLMLMFKTLGSGNWRSVIISSLLFSFVAYYLFVQILTIPLPMGVIFNL